MSDDGVYHLRTEGVGIRVIGRIEGVIGLIFDWCMGFADNFVGNF